MRPASDWVMRCESRRLSDPVRIHRPMRRPARRSRSMYSSRYDMISGARWISSSTAPSPASNESRNPRGSCSAIRSTSGDSITASLCPGNRLRTSDDLPLCRGPTIPTAGNVAAERSTSGPMDLGTSGSMLGAYDPLRTNHDRIVVYPKVISDPPHALTRAPAPSRPHQSTGSHSCSSRRAAGRSSRAHTKSAGSGRSRSSCCTRCRDRTACARPCR